MRETDHLGAYADHTHAAIALADTEHHAWACVAYFYAAYHQARWALKQDVRFKDITALKAIHRDLTPDDRHTSRHQARTTGGRDGFGVNQLVRLLYPEVGASYDKLHQVSVAVRYEPRHQPDALPDPSTLARYMRDVEHALSRRVLLPDEGTWATVGAPLQGQA